MNRPETIEETAALVDEAGGREIAAQQRTRYGSGVGNRIASIRIWSLASVSAVIQPI
jgi:hypothetical protein